MKVVLQIAKILYVMISQETVLNVNQIINMETHVKKNVPNFVIHHPQVLFVPGKKENAYIIALQEIFLMSNVLNVLQDFTLKMKDVIKLVQFIAKIFVVQLMEIVLDVMMDFGKQNATKNAMIYAKMDVNKIMVNAIIVEMGIIKMNLWKQVAVHVQKIVRNAKIKKNVNRVEKENMEKNVIKIVIKIAKIIVAKLMEIAIAIHIIMEMIVQKIV